MPNRNHKPETEHGRPARIRNLFDPFIPLSNPEEWILDRKDVSETEFGKIALAVRKLIPWVPEDFLRRDRKHLEVEIAGVRMGLGTLSAGYQTIIALVLDIYKELRRHFKDMELAEGVVLLDEIGEHLHPVWKKRISKDLRCIFPRVQFIATTHDPLCLRGVRGHEVVLMRRSPSGRFYSTTGLPPVEDMRLDQILTSEFFGLNTLYDDNLDRMFEDYYRLLAKPSWTTGEARRLKRLRGQIAKHEVIGNTRRERLVVNAIDRYLAREKYAAGAMNVLRLEEELDKEIEQALKRKD